jgi:alpha-ribazole phosphatase
VLLVRHAPTADNVGGRLMGASVDPPALPEGLERARSIVLPEAVSRVVCSPARRAVQTARALVPELEPVLDERWRERSFGAWEGLAKSEVPAEALNTRGAVRLDAEPPGGEAWEALRGRVAAALADVGPGDLVVAHNGTLRAALVVLGRLTLPEAAEASLTHLEVLTVP